MTEFKREPNDLDAIELQFIQEWDEGANPTLQQYVAKYPEYAREITEFVLDFVEYDAAVARTPEPLQASEAADRGIERALSGILARPASLLTIIEAIKAIATH